jgi:uncharacterized protein (DUF2141 family)
MRASTRNSRIGASAIALTVLAFGAIASAQAAATPAASANVIHVHYVGMSSDTGRAGCAIWSGTEGWPRKRELAAQRAWAPIKDGNAVCDFAGLPPGTYAVATFHDRDMSGGMTFNFIGLPTESYGFSNDAPVGLGPPSFRAASFPYSGGSLDITIHAKK